MSSNDKGIIRFGKKNFEIVTDETTGKEIFSLEEAKHYGETGERITTSK